MKFQVCLANPYKLWYRWDELKEKVGVYFNQAIAKRKELGLKPDLELVVFNTYSQSTAEGIDLRHDLIVYVVPYRDCGFVGVDVGSGGRSQDAGGLTWPDKDNSAAEVYVGDERISSGEGTTIRADWFDPNRFTVTQYREPDLLAKVILHEAMHNKTGWGDDKLHKHGGLAGAVIDARGSKFTDSDATIMAKHMYDVRTQWTGAWGALARR